MTMSPYVRRLRALVGHDLLLLPSVTVVPRDDRGRVLLVRRADDGQWAAIGGMVEPGERPEDAACREALEEAGVEVALRGILVVVAVDLFVARSEAPHRSTCHGCNLRLIPRRSWTTPCPS